VKLNAVAGKGDVRIRVGMDRRDHYQMTIHVSIRQNKVFAAVQVLL
jgi:hypothetical protein